MHWIIRIGWSALAVFFGVALPSLVSAQTFINWEGYLHDQTHSSFNSQATAAITPANATALVPAWSWRAGSSLFASPTVYNGRIYIGAKSGVFYTLDEATGAVVWQRFLGDAPKLTCHGGPWLSSDSDSRRRSQHTGTDRLRVLPRRESVRTQRRRRHHRVVVECVYPFQYGQ